MKRLLLFVGILGILTVARPASAAMIVGAQLFADGGVVTAHFMGHTAGLTSELYLYDAVNGNLLYTANSGVIFNNHTNTAGDQVVLGTFAAGTELVFSIKILNNGDQFWMGPANRNVDNVAHGAVDDGNPPPFPTYPPGFIPPPAGFTGVGFEDLLGGGDLDYDDLGFAFSSVRRTPNAAPEPMSLSLLALGLVGMGVRRMRQRRG